MRTSYWLVQIARLNGVTTTGLPEWNTIVQAASKEEAIQKFEANLDADDKEWLDWGPKCLVVCEERVFTDGVMRIGG